MKKPLATEHALQASIIQYLALKARREVYYFAIPNAAKRSPRLAARMKAEGLKSGPADLCFMFPKGRCAWLELKRSSKHKQTLVQNEFGEICFSLGHPYAVAHSFDEALDILRQWSVIS